MKLKVLNKTHTRRETVDGKRRSVTYQAGDVFEGTERELKAFKGRLARATVVVEDSEPQGDDDPGASGAAALEDLTVAELRKIADEAGLDSAGLRKAELISAIESALEDGDAVE